jgi:threonine dehydratase
VPSREWHIPTLADVHEARRRIAPHLRETPLYRYPALDELLGTSVWVKHENHHEVGAFKVRGGVNLVAQASDEERSHGFICASTGNHGQSIAFAARLFGARATIVVPENANPVKVASMRGLGAQIIHFGPDFDAAREHCAKLAREQGLRYVHSGDEPLLIAGVGTIYLEMLEQQPDIDLVFVPIGGGSSAAGACVVAAEMKPALRVVGVQSDAAPSAYRSWRAHSMIDDVTATYAEGLATRTPFELPQLVMWKLLREFILVSDDEIRTAQAEMIRTTRNLTEGAGAAPLAGAMRMRDELRGKNLCLILSGGNASPEQLIEVLSAAGG